MRPIYRVIVEKQHLPAWYTAQNGQITYEFLDHHEALMWRDYEIHQLGNRAWLDESKRGNGL